MGLVMGRDLCVAIRSLENRFAKKSFLRKHNCITPHYAALHFVMPNYTALHRSMPRCTALHRVAPHYAALRRSTRYYAVVRSLTPYYAVLRRATLCYAALRHTTPYNAALRCTTLHYTEFGRSIAGRALSRRAPCFAVRFSVQHRTPPHCTVLRRTMLNYAARCWLHLFASCVLRRTTLPYTVLHRCRAP